MSNTKLKPLYLSDLFHKNTDSEHRVSVNELVDMLEKLGISAERKGLYRDIDALVEYGLDIKKTTSGYFLDKRKFSLAEIRILISAVQSASFISDKRTQELVSKLMDYLSVYQAEAILQQSNIATVKNDNEEIFTIIEAVNIAISKCRRISFSYYKRDLNRRDVIQRHGRRYRVSPYAMIWEQDKYYLVCNMDERDDLTHFRLDRMKNVRIEPMAWRHFSQVSEYKSSFNIADYARKCYNMYGGAVENVTLRCSNAILNDVFDRFGNDIIPKRDGMEHFIFSVKASVGIGLISWISQFGENIEIIAPDHLRSEMILRLNKMMSLYKS